MPAAGSSWKGTWLVSATRCIRASEVGVFDAAGFSGMSGPETAFLSGPWQRRCLRLGPHIPLGWVKAAPRVPSHGMEPCLPPRPSQGPSAGLRVSTLSPCDAAQPWVHMVPADPGARGQLPPFVIMNRAEGKRALFLRGN